MGDIDINYIIDLAISYGPTILFLIIIFFAALSGLIRGLRKSVILAMHALCAATLCITLFFILTKNKTMDAFLLQIVNSILGGEGSIESMLGVSGEFETLKEVLVQGLPNILNFGDSITILLKENGAYIYTLVDMIYNIVFAIVLLVLYYVLIFLLYIIYLIFYSERKYKRRKNRAFAEKKTDRTYKKHPLFGSLVGLTRGLVAGLIMLSFMGSSLYIIAGTGEGKMEELSLDDPTTNMVYGAYRSVENYGSSGVFKVLNTFKSAEEQPYYLFAADLIFSGGLEIEDLEINENIKFREEIGTYVGFARDVVNLLIKHGGDNVENMLNGKESANMDFVVEIMKQEQFQADFESLIKDFDSKTYFINLAFAMVTSIINNIDMFASGLDPAISELVKIMFVKGHYSEYIPDEREALQVKESKRYSKGKEKELETLPYIHVSKLIEREDILTVFKLLTSMLDEQTSEAESADALDTVKEILPYISELSIFKDRRKNEMDPVLTRLYCFVENKFLTNEGYDGVRYKDLKDENISWVDEINSLVSVASDIFSLYDNIKTEDGEVLDMILSIFDDENVKYEENIALYDKASKTIADSKLLGKVLASNKMNGVIKEALSSVSPNMYIPENIVFENKYDDNGNLTSEGEIQKVFSSLRILTSKENKGVIDALFNPEEGTDMFDTLETVSTVINNKDENGKSIVDYFLDSSVMHAVISSLLVDLGAEGDMMIYVPESSLMTNENNEKVNLVNKKELNDILVALPEIIKEIKPVIEGEDAFTAIDSILENETIDNLLNSGNMIIEATFSNVIIDALSGVDMVKLPKSLQTVESWLSVNGTPGEFRHILSFVSDSSVDFKTLLDGEDKMSVITSLTSDDITLLLNSQVLHYSISNIICENSVDMGSFKIIVPASAKLKLENDSLPYLIKKVELQTLFEEFINLNLDTETDFSKVLIQFVDRFIQSDKEGNSILERSSILSTSLIDFLVNDESIGGFITMPEELKEEVVDTTTKGLENYNSSYLWYNELPSLVFALEEMFNITSQDDDFVLGGEGEDGDLITQLSDLITSFREPSHIESKKDDNTRLDMIYASKVMRHNLTVELEKSLTKSGTVSEATIEKAKDGEYILKSEFYAISDCMDIFGIDDLLNFDDEQLTYNVKHAINNLNKPREEAKYNNRTGLDVMYDSVIITTLFTEKLEESLVSIVKPDVLTYEKVKKDGIFVKEEIANLIDGINTLNITDMDNIGTHSFSINEIRTNLNDIYKSHILGGAFTKIISDNTGDGKILQDHPYAYIEDEHHNKISIYRYEEIETLLDVVPSDVEMENVSYEHISLSSVRNAVYDESGYTKSYILVSTISNNLVNEEKQTDTLVVPRHTIDTTVEGERVLVQPVHLGQLLMALERLGKDNLEGSGMHFETTFPHEEDRDIILSSEIMRASFTKMIKKANNNEEDLLIFKEENITTDKDVHNNDIVVIAKEQLVALFEALEYFEGPNGSLSIPNINNITMIKDYFEDETKAKKLFEADIFRYRIVGIINDAVSLYNELPLADITYNVTNEDSYNIYKDIRLTSISSTYEATHEVLELMHI